MTDLRQSRSPDRPSTFGGLIERMVTFRIELSGMDISGLTEKECRVLGEQCARLDEQIHQMLAYLETYDDGGDITG